MKLGARTRLPALLGILVMALVGAALEVVGVGLVFPLITLIYDPGLIEESAALARVYAWIGAGSPRDFVVILALIMVGVFLAKSAYMALLHYLETRVLAAWKLETNRRLMTGYLHSPYERAIDRHSAETVRTVAKLVPKLFDGFVHAYLVLAVNVIVALAIVAMTVVVEPTVTILALALPLLYVQNRGLRRRFAVLGTELAPVSRDRQKALQESFGALKEAKVLGREAYFLGRFTTVESRFVDNRRRYKFLGSLPPLLIEATLTTTVLLLIIFVLTADRSPGTALASLGLLGAASIRLAPVINRILAALNTIKYGEHTARLVADDLEMADRLPDTAPAGAGRGRFEQLQVDNVSFVYPRAGRPSLRNISLTIRAGESIGLAGPSGAGKTTLADIILGLFEPTAGCLRVDGVPIPGRSRAWRGAVGYVPQPVYILDDTVRRNVAFGLPDDEIDDERVWHALEQARLADHVFGLPGGLGAALGENGSRLSAGQRQRVGIARALYHDPDLLVLDEATSMLDTATENEVAGAILALKGQTTLIVIAHRRATLESCDRLVFLRDGRIEALGTPADLPPEPARLMPVPSSVA